MSWFTTAQNLSAGSGKQPLMQLHMQTYSAWTSLAPSTSIHAKMVSLSNRYLVPMWSTVNGGLPLLALPFFRVVYADTDGCWLSITHQKQLIFAIPSKHYKSSLIHHSLLKTRIWGCLQGVTKKFLTQPHQPDYKGCVAFAIYCPWSDPFKLSIWVHNYSQICRAELFHPSSWSWQKRLDLWIFIFRSSGCQKPISRDFLQ